MTAASPMTFEQRTPAVASSDLLGGDMRRQNPKDVVMTPTQIAVSIVNHFKPTGRILEPCRGSGNIAKLMPGCEWCEITEGRDFFHWHEPVDWIVSNPPYSTFYEWMCHSFTLADDIVYLIPLHKLFSGSKYLKRITEYGGIKEVMNMGSANIVGFPVGFAIGAVHFRRNYRGETRIWTAA